jgi:hypothetical protein
VHKGKERSPRSASSVSRHFPRRRAVTYHRRLPPSSAAAWPPACASEDAVRRGQETGPARKRSPCSRLIHAGHDAEDGGEGLAESISVGDFGYERTLRLYGKIPLPDVTTLLRRADR